MKKLGWTFVFALLSVSSVRAGCNEIFLADSRFHWLPMEESWRQPPNVFPSMFAAMFFPALDQLPAGLKADEQAFYQHVFEFLRDRNAVYDALQVLEEKLKSQTIEQIFEPLEKKYGFKNVVIDGVPTSEDWLRWVREGAVFTDHGSHLVVMQLLKDVVSFPGRWRHLKYSHRLQWHLVLQSLEGQAIDPSQVFRFYTQLGESDFSARLDWSQTSVARLSPSADARKLYFQLFDSPENNGSSPGFYDEYREYWPAVAAALE